MRLSMFIVPLLCAAACRTEGRLPVPGAVERASQRPEHAVAQGAWTDLLAAPSGSWAATEFGGEGAVVFDAGGLTMEAGSPLTGVTWQGAAPPRTDYELEVEATRLAGSDFFCGLTFPVNDAHLTLVLGGWGGALTGLSSLNGQDAFENGTASYVNYETKRPYRARVRVDGERVRTYLAGKPLHDIDTGRRRPSLRVEVMASRPLGVASFDTRARISTLRLRRRQPVFSADFASPADLAQMEFSDRSAWEQGAAGKQSWLELKDASDYRPPHRSPHSLALVRNLEVEDFALTVRAQQTGREYGHRDLCLILAWRDAAHFAYVHLASQPDEHAHNLFLVDGAARRRLGEVRSKGVDWGSDLWHDIRLEKEGAGVRVFFDGALALDVVCSEPLPAGRVGLGSFDDTGRFSELRIFADAANEAGKPPAFSAGR